MSDDLQRPKLSALVDIPDEDLVDIVAAAQRCVRQPAEAFGLLPDPGSLGQRNAGRAILVALRFGPATSQYVLKFMVL